MPTFESWATAVADVIEEKLGFKNVSSEIFEDHAIWTSRLNRAIARPDDDGHNVTVVFDKGTGHRYDLAGGTHDAGAEVTGRLLGMIT